MTADVLAAESCVCGSILLDARCLPEVMEYISADDFALEANRAIFRAAVELSRLNETVDPVTIRSKAGEAASQEYMLDLMQMTQTAANAGVYAQETRKASMRRRLKIIGESISTRSGQSDEPRSVIADAQREFEEIESLDTAQELASSTEVLGAFYEHRGKVDQGGGGFVPLGFRSLDRLLGGGLLNSGFYILAARPGMGKTTFGLQVADAVAEQTGPVLFVSLEMDAEQIGAKRLGRIAGISSDSLLMGRPNEEEWARAAKLGRQLSDTPVFLNKRPQATVDDIAHMARKVRGLRLVVIDYFGLIRPTGKYRSRYESATETSGQLKALARALKVPILCLAQINRENTQRQDKRPQLSDLRDTGALEQDADGVIFLHCPYYYQNGESSPWEPEPMEIILAKNRHASTGKCDAVFYKAVGRIIPERAG
ncbi:MAG: DnaB-like helicase C-terminal domain-containing protein [Flavonifractor plautii]|nr:DnaB-like helicase C-terminal domain-containing protein [Flavonifractor plautii]